MQIKLGEKIRSLRIRDGRKQEDLATALGVTNQAVSRWEANKGYPDMETIPAIANYFHISIDELFGYDNDRETRLAKYISQADHMGEHVGECMRNAPEEQETFLRKALEEFPNEWQLQMRLAWVLQYRAWLNTSDDPDISMLKESAALLEKARPCITDLYWKESVTRTLANIYEQTGESGKIEKLAADNSPVYTSREVLRTHTPGANKKSRFFGEAILALLHELAQMTEGAYTSDTDFSKAQDPTAFIALAELYKAMFDGGNYGLFNSDLCLLYLRAAGICAKKGERRRTLEYFDAAYIHQQAYRKSFNKKENRPDSPLFRTAVELPRNYIFIQNTIMRSRVATFSEETANAIKSNTKYESIFQNQ